MSTGSGPRSPARWVFLVVFAALAAGALLAISRLGGDGPAPFGTATATSAAGSRTGAPRRDDGDDEREAPRVFEEETPEGTLALRGQVIDAEEDPVAGAVITLSSNPPRETVSTESGLFSFDGLPGGRYSVAARSEEGFAGPVTVELTERTEPVILRVRVAPPLAIRVVKAADREPVGGASWELRGPLTVSGLTDAEGLAEVRALPPGSYTAVAWAGGTAKTFQDVFLPAERGPTALELALVDGCTVEGRVVDAESRPVEGAVVGFERASARGGGPDPLRDGTVSGKDGGFKLSGLAQGTYRFTARHDDSAPGSSPLVGVTAHRPVTDVLIQLKPGGTVAGRVVDGDGAAIAGAAVRVAPTLGRPAVEIRQTVTDDRGEFHVKGLPRTEVELVASAVKGSSESLLVDLSNRPERKDLVLTIAAGGTISGVVVDSEGEPVAEAQVTAVPDATKGNTGVSMLRGMPRDVTDAGGKFTVRGLASGWYSLRAAPPGSLRSLEWSSQRGVSAQVGDSSVRIVLEASGKVSGRVQFADGTVPPVYLVAVGTGVGSSFSAPDGAFTLDEVPAGKTSIVVSGPGFTRRSVHDVSITPGRATDIGTVVVVKGRTISGRVLDRSGGGVSGATVFIGGRVIGDGEKLTTEAWGSTSNAARTVESDESGMFTVTGISSQSVALIADHPTVGRSATVVVPESPQNSSVDLLLIPTGAIEGLVTKAGEPVANISINASPRSIANSSNFVVKTGADGRFRFERVAPDKYLVSAMIGVTPVGGISMQSGVTVDVPEGGTAAANLELSPTATTLIVSPTLPDGSVTKLAEIHVLSGLVTATVARAVHDRVAAFDGGFSSFAILIGGQPVKIKNVPQGEHTVCVIPYPSPLMAQNKAKIDDYVDTYGAKMPAVCLPVTVLGDPEESVSVPVTEPPYEEKKDPAPETKPAPEGPEEPVQ